MTERLAVERGGRCDSRPERVQALRALVIVRQVGGAASVVNVPVHRDVLQSRALEANRPGRRPDPGGLRPHVARDRSACWIDDRQAARFVRGRENGVVGCAGVAAAHAGRVAGGAQRDAVGRKAGEIAQVGRRSIRFLHQESLGIEREERVGFVVIGLHFEANLGRRLRLPVDRAQKVVAAVALVLLEQRVVLQDRVGRAEGRALPWCCANTPSR